MNERNASRGTVRAKGINEDGVAVSPARGGGVTVSKTERRWVITLPVPTRGTPGRNCRYGVCWRQQTMEEKWEVKSYFWVNISQRYFHFLVYGSNVHSSGVGAQWCLLSTEEQWAKFF